jgi:hypothetical protein
MEILYAYIGRDNEERLELKQAGALVTAGAVTRAVLKFCSFCLDTDVDADEIYFLDSDNQTLCMKLGLVDDMAVGAYRDGKLTIYDAANTEGIAWADIGVVSLAWDVCAA